MKRAGFEDQQAVAEHRLLPIALAQLDSGCTPRPRTPDWSEAELIIGTALNEALVKGTDGSAELDQAAKDVKAKLDSLGLLLGRWRTSQQTGATARAGEGGRARARPCPTSSSRLRCCSCWP